LVTKYLKEIGDGKSTDILERRYLKN